MWRSLVLAFLLFGMTLGPVWAQQATEPKEKDAIKEAMQKHDEALNKQDLAALMDTYASNANIILMGTGPGEVWVGKQNIEEAYKHFFEDFKAGSLKHDCPWSMSDQKDNVAWLAASCQMQDVRKKGKRSYGLNLSAMLIKEQAGWKFQMMHFSNLTAGK